MQRHRFISSTIENTEKKVLVGKRQVAGLPLVYSAPTEQG